MMGMMFSGPGPFGKGPSDFQDWSASQQPTASKQSIGDFVKGLSFPYTGEGVRAMVKEVLRVYRGRGIGVYKSHLIMAIAKKAYPKDELNFSEGLGETVYAIIDSIIKSMIKDGVLKKWVKNEPLELVTQEPEKRMYIEQNPVPRHIAQTPKEVCKTCKGKKKVKCSKFKETCNIESDLCERHNLYCEKECPDCKGTGQVARVPSFENGGIVPNSKSLNDMVHVYTNLVVNPIKLSDDVRNSYFDTFNIVHDPGKQEKIDCPDCEGTGNGCSGCLGDCYEGANRLCEHANEYKHHDCETCNGEGEIDKPDKDMLDGARSALEGNRGTMKMWIEESGKITPEAFKGIGNMARNKYHNVKEVRICSELDPVIRVQDRKNREQSILNRVIIDRE